MENKRLHFSELLTQMDAEKHPFVQAFVNNISFPTTIEELETFIYDHGHYNIEDILACNGACWTVPRNCKIGDIVLWMHAKTAISRITALITQVKNLSDVAMHNKTLLLEWLAHARSLHHQYGGCIFAIGRVVSTPEYEDFSDANPCHWNGRIYADIGDIVVLSMPIHINEFNTFITISRQSAITHLPGKEFDRLRNLIQSKNSNLPYYFIHSKIGNFTLANITRNNFLEVTQEYRRRFMYEADFRSNYVDHLLHAIAGRKVYRECICRSQNHPHYFVDNVFKSGNKYFLLEVKLNILLEPNLSAQLDQYIFADSLQLTQKEDWLITDFERKFMYVIDTNALFSYKPETAQLKKLIDLDQVRKIEDILQFFPTN